MSSNSKDARHCTILNTRINVTNMDSAINYLTTELDSLRGKYICVANVHTTVMAYRDSEYRHIQNSAAMVLPDGKPLSYVSRRRGFGDAERVTGPDLMPRIFDISAEDGFRHYFFGGTEETLEKLYERLNESWPQLENAGMFSPPFRAATPSEKEEIIERINAARPDFIWVALGAPKQEQWMYEHRGQFNGVMIGVGAAFDFLSGTTRRAPRIMQELYLEWLFRIFKDPFRLIPRYFDTNFTYVRQAGKETRRFKKENKHKKIAMIGHKRIPSREGGVEIVVDEIATRLVERGYQVDAYNRSGYHVSGKEFDEKRSRFYNGIRLITIPTFRDSKLNAIVYSGLATVRALFGGYGIIHYHAEGPSVMLRVPRFFGIRVVATIHGLDWQRAKWGGFASKVLRFGEKTAARKANEVIVLSQNVKDYFKSTYGREVRFIPNGITKPERHPADIITEKHGLKKDDYILFLARLVPEKGAHYLIEAFNQFKQASPGKKLVITGGNSDAVGYWGKICDYAAANDDIIMTGFVQGRELSELFSNAYLFVAPSDVEGMAISLLEAMSYGNCCLVSDIPENTEVVEQAALSFRKGDIADLKEKIEWLIKNPDAVDGYRRGSSDFICGKYNWDDVVDETVRVYHREQK